jgi:hypothetical protein
MTKNERKLLKALNKILFVLYNKGIGPNPELGRAIREANILTVKFK